MELAETRTTQTENAEESQKIKEALRKLLDKNPKGGEITLNEFCKEVPDASKSEVVRVLKKSTQGVFITGRRGKHSRFKYGTPALPLIKTQETTGKRVGRPRKVPASPVTQFEGPSLMLEVQTQYGNIKIPGKVVSLATT